MKQIFTAFLFSLSLAHLVLADSWQNLDRFEYKGAENAFPKKLAEHPSGALVVVGFYDKQKGNDGESGWVVRISDANHQNFQTVDVFRPGDGAASEVVVDADGRIFVSGQAMLLKTREALYFVRVSEDLGKTWKTIFERRGFFTASANEQLSLDPKGRPLFVVPESSSNEANMVALVYDKGAGNWTEFFKLPAELDRRMGSIKSDGKDLFLLGGPGRSEIYRSQDMGKSWAVVFKMEQPGAVISIRDLAFDSKGSFVAVGVAIHKDRNSETSTVIVRGQDGNSKGTAQLYASTEYKYASPQFLVLDGDKLFLGTDVLVDQPKRTRLWIIQSLQAGESTLKTEDIFSGEPGSYSEIQGMIKLKSKKVAVTGSSTCKKLLHKWIVRGN